MPWQGSSSGAIYNIASLFEAVSRLHELIGERVWKIRMLSILEVFSEVVISQFDMASRDLHPACQGMG